MADDGGHDAASAGEVVSLVDRRRLSGDASARLDLLVTAFLFIAKFDGEQVNLTKWFAVAAVALKREMGQRLSLEDLNHVMDTAGMSALSVTDPESDLASFLRLSGESEIALTEDGHDLVEALITG